MSKLFTLCWVACSGWWTSQAIVAYAVGDYHSAVDAVIGVGLMLTNIRLDMAIWRIETERREP